MGHNSIGEGFTSLKISIISDYIRVKKLEKKIDCYRYIELNS